jgi:hypothetical protein
VRLAFSRRAAESPLTRRRRRASAHPRRLNARAFPRPTRTPRDLFRAPRPSRIWGRARATRSRRHPRSAPRTRFTRHRR